MANGNMHVQQSYQQVKQPQAQPQAQAQAQAQPKAEEQKKDEVKEEKQAEQPKEVKQIARQSKVSNAADYSTNVQTLKAEASATTHNETAPDSVPELSILFLI